MRLHDVRPQPHRLAPFRLRPAGIADLIERQTKLVVRDRIIRIVLQDTLQGIDRIRVLTPVHLNFRLVNLRVRVRRLRLQHFVIQLARLVRAVAHDKQLNVVLLHNRIFGMLLV